MFSTTTIIKNSKFSGKVVGTHQKLAQAARFSLARQVPRDKYFPASKEIIYFEGTRGPDGLKRKSPGVDEPSYILTNSDFHDYTEHKNKNSQDNLARSPLKSSASFQESIKTPAQPTSARQLEQTLAENGPANELGHENLDERSVITMMLDHRWNLVRALRRGDHVRAAFEAAWMEHAIVDGLTPAHHFPLTDVKNELMTDKELMRVFGQPVKGLMHGRNMLETMRNNWLYWGAGGHMSKHIAYEYGVLMIAAPLSTRTLAVKLSPEDLAHLDTEEMFCAAFDRVHQLDLYTRFLDEGWTTELAIITKDTLLPEIVRTVALGWYSAIAEAYHLRKSPHEKAK